MVSLRPQHALCRSRNQAVDERVDGLVRDVHPARQAEPVEILLVWVSGYHRESVVERCGGGVGGGGEGEPKLVARDA